MRRLTKIFCSGALVLLASDTTAWQTGRPATAGAGSVAAVEVPADRPYLLAQKTQPAPETPKAAPAPAPAMDQVKPPEAPAPQMEKQPKAMRRSEPMERAGTRKLGGEVIRNKEE